MPQKRNPISCAYIHACVSMVRQHVAALLDAMVEDHERSTGPWEIEWIALPEIFCLSAGALAQARFVLGGPRIDASAHAPEPRRHRRAHRVGSRDDGAWPSLGRQRAHDLVYDVCREVIASGRPFLDLLAENREIAPHLDRAALAKLLEPSNYLGLCGEMVDRVLAREG